MKNPGIHFRLLMAAFLLIGATTLTLGYMGVHITHNFVQTRFEERMLFLAKYLALNSELGILIDERAMLQRLARNLLSEKDVVRVAISDALGDCLADVSRNSPSPRAEIEVPVYLTETPEESLSFQWSIDGKPDDQKIGMVSITYTTMGIDRLLSIMKIRFIWLSIGLAVFAMIIFYFISRSLVSPVTYLVKSVRKVAQGDLSFRVKPGRLPETRNLAVAVNVMLDSLENSRKALEEANLKMIRQKTLAEMGKFSMMIAHEVKNPLSIIKSSLDILKKDINPSYRTTMIEYIDDEVKRLNRLIEDFLLFAKPATPNFRTVDLNQMLHTAINRFCIRIANSDVEIKASIEETPCIAQADPDLLNRAVDNVLKNAFEADENQGTIDIRTLRNENEWSVQIADQGGGVDTNNMEKIFEPFFTTRSKGTGLGLAFASQVVKSHGGAISARNSDNGGAVFTITIPYS